MPRQMPIDQTVRSSHAVIIRSGALGDFLLTVPLIHALAGLYARTTVITRIPYANLVNRDLAVSAWLDIDGSEAASLYSTPRPTLRDLFHEADVFSFLPDPEGTVKDSLDRLGAIRYVRLESRPTSPPHVTLRMFRDAGLMPPDDLLSKPWLARGPIVGDVALWLHPGSGSRSKNAPLDLFHREAVDWLTKGGKEIVLVFGEADLPLEAETEEIFADIPHRTLRLPSLQELRQGLEGAARFIGNDSGVTHLAAQIGVPVTACFLTTDPETWRPIGPRVEVKCLSL